MIQPRYERPDSSGLWLFFPAGKRYPPLIIKVAEVGITENGKWRTAGYYVIGAPADSTIGKGDRVKDLDGWWAGPIEKRDCPVDRIGWGHHHYDCKIVSEGRGQATEWDCSPECPTLGIEKPPTPNLRKTWDDAKVKAEEHRATSPGEFCGVPITEAKAKQ